MDGNLPLEVEYFTRLEVSKLVCLLLASQSACLSPVLPLDCARGKGGNARIG